MKRAITILLLPLVALVIVALTPSDVLATITKMNGQSITTSTKINGNAMTKANGVSITAGGGGGTVTFDAVSSSTGTAVSGAVNTASFGITVGSGLTNTYIVVGARIGSSTVVPTVSSVTIDGSSTGVSQITSATSLVGGSGHGRVDMWGIKAPTAGAHTIVVNLSANMDASGSSMNVGAISFSRVDQTTPFSNGASANGSGTTASKAFTSAANNAVVAIACGGDSFSAWQAVDRMHNNDSTGSGGGCGGTSSAAGAASVTMSWTLASDSWAVAGCNLNHD